MVVVGVGGAGVRRARSTDWCRLRVPDGKIPHPIPPPFPFGYDQRGGGVVDGYMGCFIVALGHPGHTRGSINQ